MLRRTKIVATLGPATDDPKVLDELIAAGVDVVRVNLSHGDHDTHAERAENLRNRARASGRQVGVLVDLQGPKIRIGRFAEGPVALDPRHPDAIYNRGLILMEDGQLEVARKHFARVLEISPGYEPARLGLEEVEKRIRKDRQSG